MIRNNIYEYNVEVVPDKNDGSVDITRLKILLDNYARQGWRLISVFTNELGKNNTSVGIAGIGASVNATMEQTILIFERIRQTSEEMQKREELLQENYSKKFEKNKELRENVYKACGLDPRLNIQPFELYRKHPEKIELIKYIISTYDDEFTVREISEAFEDKVSVMDIAPYMDKLVKEGYVEKNNDTKKYKYLGES